MQWYSSERPEALQLVFSYWDYSLRSLLKLSRWTADANKLIILIIIKRKELLGQLLQAPNTGSRHLGDFVSIQVELRERAGQTYEPTWHCWRE